MNNLELNEMLAQMSQEERNLVLAADDALDAYYSYKLNKEYGVTVICNPDGDRTKISIDGVIMNHEEFANWLLEKQIEKYGLAEEDFDSEDSEEEDL